MTRFATFDPDATQPTPVIGWYDTDALIYPTLPPENARVVVTDDQVWSDRLLYTQVSAGQLVQTAVESTDVILAAQLRGKRDTLLTQSDWTQIADNALTDDQRAAWKTYREALRNVPDQTGFPNSVTWPTNPT